MGLFDKEYAFSDPAYGTQRVTRSKAKTNQQLQAVQRQSYKDLIAGHFGRFLAERFDPYSIAVWEEMDVRDIHPVLKPVLYETATFEFTAMAAADLIHEMFSLRVLAKKDVIGAMQRVWKVLISDPNQSPLYPSPDVDLFALNYAGPSMEAYNKERVWKSIKNIEEILLKAGFKQDIMPKLKKAYEAYFKTTETVLQPPEAFSHVQYSTYEARKGNKKSDKQQKQEDEALLQEAKDTTAQFTSLLNNLKAFQMKPNAASTPYEAAGASSDRPVSPKMPSMIPIYEDRFKQRYDDTKDGANSNSKSNKVQNPGYNTEGSDSDDSHHSDTPVFPPRPRRFQTNKSDKGSVSFKSRADQTPASISKLYTARGSYEQESDSSSDSEDSTPPMRRKMIPKAANPSPIRKVSRKDKTKGTTASGKGDSKKITQFFPKNYDGTGSPEASLGHWYNFVDYLEYHQITSDAEILRLFKKSLIGSARAWFQQLPPNLTCEELREEFLNKYHLDIGSRTTASDKFWNFEKRSNETWGEAINRLKMLNDRLQYTEQTVLDKIIGLLPLQVRLRMREIQPMSVAEVLEIIRFYEREGLDTNAPVKNATVKKAHVMMDRPIYLAGTRPQVYMQQGPYGDVNADVVCYKCSQYGHYQRQCPYGQGNQFAGANYGQYVQPRYQGPPIPYRQPLNHGMPYQSQPNMRNQRYRGPPNNQQYGGHHVNNQSAHAPQPPPRGRSNNGNGRPSFNQYNERQNNGVNAHSRRQNNDHFHQGNH